MALKSTVYKATLNITDMDRQYYASHSLTLAMHPSETDERLMVRVLAFALFANEQLQLCKGLSDDDEPDLWEKDLTEQVLHWIELGLPDETRIRKASNRAQRVTVISYGERSPAIWWEKVKDKISRFDNVTVINLAAEASQALAAMIARGMELQVTIEGGHAWISDASTTVEVVPEYWRRAQD